MFHPFGSFCDGIVVIPDRLLERQACSSLCCSQQYAGSLSWCSFEAAKFHQRVKKFMGQGYEPIPGWGFQHLSYRLKRFILVLDDDDYYYCYNCYYYYYSSYYNILLLPAINKPGGLKPPTEITSCGTMAMMHLQHEKTLDMEVSEVMGVPQIIQVMNDHFCIETHVLGDSPMT